MSLELEQASAIARKLGLDEHGLSVRPIGGGDIAKSHLLEASDARVFLKSLPLGQSGLLSAEADGLQAISETHTVRTPRRIGRGVHGDTAWLALEFLQLETRTPSCDARLGRELAAMHGHCGERFGWHRNNYIGLTAQRNEQSDDWGDFFAEQRLAPQFERVARREPDGRWAAISHAVLEAWSRVSAGHRPEPCLLHGDLWRGNAAQIGDDTPVVYDPAVHYGDRECDLAMTHLFGGFDDAFYAAYDSAWPLPDGAAERRLFYKLYHMLNHANLFGGPYLEASQRLCGRIVEGQV
jgi:fructosamine-3-kinase